MSSNELDKLAVLLRQERQTLLTRWRKQVRELMQSDYHYCGAPPSRLRTVKNGDGVFTYNGIDRVNNSEGYSADNVVPCCTTCNFSKGRRSYAEFVQWAARIAAKRGGSAWTALVG